MKSKYQILVEAATELISKDLILRSLNNQLLRLTETSVRGTSSDGNLIYKNESQIQDLQLEIESRMKLIIDSQFTK
ncbi:hypothetical protein WAF17_16535 [Bernardetia sp. ABR2-2B]|uniref:hypothetical protein n=1 Tax=Bernardetia sp. ABR2-2B TaxID=3127472 RepID=UPI0030D18687